VAFSNCRPSAANEADPKRLGNNQLSLSGALRVPCRTVCPAGGGGCRLGLGNFSGWDSPGGLRRSPGDASWPELNSRGTSIGAMGCAMRWRLHGKMTTTRPDRHIAAIKNMDALAGSVIRTTVAGIWSVTHAPSPQDGCRFGQQPFPFITAYVILALITDCGSAVFVSARSLLICGVLPAYRQNSTYRPP
jgi:hypothetical protein